MTELSLYHSGESKGAKTPAFSESGPLGYQTAGMTRGLGPIGKLLWCDENQVNRAGGSSWAQPGTQTDKGRGLQRTRESKKGVLLPATPSLPSPCPRPATDTEPPANLGSTHAHSRANGPLSNSAALMKCDPTLSRGPRALSPEATLPYLLGQLYPHTYDGFPKPVIRHPLVLTLAPKG